MPRVDKKNNRKSTTCPWVGLKAQAFQQICAQKSLRTLLHAHGGCEAVACIQDNLYSPFSMLSPLLAMHGNQKGVGKGRAGTPNQQKSSGSLPHGHVANRFTNTA